MYDKVGIPVASSCTVSPQTHVAYRVAALDNVFRSTRQANETDCVRLPSLHLGCELAKDLLANGRSRTTVAKQFGQRTEAFSCTVDVEAMIICAVLRNIKQILLEESLE